MHSLLLLLQYDVMKKYKVLIVSATVVFVLVGGFVWHFMTATPAQPSPTPLVTTVQNSAKAPATPSTSPTPQTLPTSAQSGATPKKTVLPPATKIPPAIAMVVSSVKDAYILAFLACDTSITTNCADPRNHRTFLAQSNDGAQWSRISDVKGIPGSVPGVIRRGETLYIYNPGTVARYHLDTGVFDHPTPVALTDSGLNEIFVDPDPIMDANGNLVLFYLPGMTGGDPAHCEPGTYSCIKTIKSATEVTGSDGTQFTVDSGDRADIAISGQDTASDPEVFQGPSGYVLYISRGPSVEAMTSPTLRGSFSNIPTLPGGMLVSNAGGVPAGYYDQTSGNYWTYITSGNGIERAVSQSISSPLSTGDFQTVLSGSSIGLGSSFVVESPDITVNQ